MSLRQRCHIVLNQPQTTVLTCVSYGCLTSSLCSFHFSRSQRQESKHHFRNPDHHARNLQPTTWVFHGDKPRSLNPAPEPTPQSTSQCHRETSCALFLKTWSPSTQSAAPTPTKQRYNRQHRHKPPRLVLNLVRHPLHHNRLLLPGPPHPHPRGPPPPFPQPPQPSTRRGTRPRPHQPHANLPHLHVRRRPRLPRPALLPQSQNRSLLHLLRRQQHRRRRCQGVGGRHARVLRKRETKFVPFFV